jgi:hypothetical protein
MHVAEIPGKNAYIFHQSGMTNVDAEVCFGLYILVIKLSVFFHSYFKRMTDISNMEGYALWGWRWWETVHSACLHDQLSNISNTIVGEVSTVLMLYFGNFLLKW